MYKNIWKPLLLVIFSVVAAVPESTSNLTNASNTTSDVLIKSSSEVKVIRLRHLWNIKDFNSLNLTLGQKLTSPSFSAKTQDDCNWKMDFYPAGINDESKTSVALFLTSLSCNVSADVRISFLNAKREQIYKREFLHDFSKTKNIGFNAFVKRELLVNKKKNVLLNNTLTIFCEVNATVVEKRSLGKDLALLLENHAFSNFIISAGGKDFQTHKSILAARSSVFRAMFETNMKKKKITRVDLKDVEQKVMKKFLRYIYTGDASNLENLAPKLLAVADKYKVNGLKTICENAMAANLTVENSAEYYILSERHSAVNLRTLARAFVVSHAAEVVQTPGFKLLIKAHPHLVEEIFSAIHRLFCVLQITLIIITFVPTSLSDDVHSENYVFKSWGSTKMKVDRLSFTWSISNFSLYELGNGISVSSPPFSGGRNNSCEWYLDLYPNGRNPIFKEYMSLFLKPIACTPTIIKFKLGIINAKLQQINVLDIFYNFEKASKEMIGGVLDFIKKDILFTQKNDILPEDKLTIFCEINATVGFENLSGKFKQPKPQLSQIGRDLAYLFENPNFGDVTVSAGGKEIKALRAILVSRSPVFKNILENETQEIKIDRIEIPDLDYEVVKEMLRYIYTEEVFNLENMVSDLLAASEKYKLDGLKTLCAKYLMENLTSENAAKFYILSETYSVVDLKVHVKDFILAHVASVVRTPEFKSMIQNYPQLVEELFGAIGDEKI